MQKRRFVPLSGWVSIRKLSPPCLGSIDAPDVEVLVQIRMLHDVDVADLLVAAHLAGGVIGFVSRFAVGPQVDDVNARPPLVRADDGEIRVDELDLWVLDRVESEAEEVVA